MKAVGEALQECLAESESLSDPARGHRRRRRHAGPRPRRAGADDRAGRRRRAARPVPGLAAICWPAASRSASRAALAAIVDELDEKIGLERLRCLHVNDSKMPLGSNRDRHASLGHGEIGRGRAAGLSLRAALRGSADDPRDGGAGPRAHRPRRGRAGAAASPRGRPQPAAKKRRRHLAEPARLR